MGLGWVGTSKNNEKGKGDIQSLRLRSGLRQRGGRLRGGLRREAEAPPYLRSKSNSNGWRSFTRHNEELRGGVLQDSGWFGCTYMRWRLR
jgi:hypothetical protein